MSNLIDVSDFPAEKVIYTLSWLVSKGSTEPCDLWRRGRDARAVQPRVIPLLGSAVASWRSPQGSRNVAPLVRCRFSSPAPIWYLWWRTDKRQSVSLLNSIWNFPDAAAASANLTPSSRSAGSEVMEVFPLSAVGVQTGTFSCGRLCLTHAKVKGGVGKKCRFLQDSTLTQVLCCHSFTRENTTFCGRAPQARY